ncbi:MAG: HAMP domain-containing sensor histidine kinase, partial [Desulfuromonadaceae bacterium]
SVSLAGEPVRGELRVAALRDVTKTRKMETELLQTQAMLEQSNAELVKADQARTEFLNIATHELRIPLAVANGYCTLLAESDQSKLSEQQRDYIQQAIAATERLSDLIDNLLDLSRLDSGRMTLDLHPHDPVQTVEEFLNDYENLIDNKQFHFESRLPLHCKALFDPEKIYRVLVNLLSNAVKFTETGGEISIVLHDADDRVLFSIEDNGKGIAAEHIPLLFEAFSQVGKQENRAGSGLGLYICRKIVEAHQGRIWVESRVGSGSKFLFSLPKVS